MPAAYLNTVSVVTGHLCNKKPFINRIMARRAMDHMKHNANGMVQRSTRGKINVYKCQFCGLFHVGNKFKKES